MQAQTLAAMNPCPDESSPAGDVLAILAIFALPFGLLYEVNFIGQLYSTELVFLILLPFLLFVGNPIDPKATRATLLLIGIWLLALMVADFYRGTFIGDYLRGWAKMIFLAINFYVLSRLLTTDQRVIAWFIGWNIAFGIFAYLGNDEWATRWKFGLGPASLHVFAGLLIATPLYRFRILPAILSLACLGFAVASLFFNARNDFLSLFISSLLLAVCSTKVTRRAFASLWDRHSWTLLVAGILFAYGAGQIYITGASSGVFGDDAREKLQSQQAVGLDPVLGTIVGGRGEFFSSTAAIGDSPLMGHGSWPRSAYYFSIYLDAVRTYGSPEAVKEANRTIYFGEPLIPVHSIFFGAWVEAGIIGAVVWVVIIRQIFKTIRSAIDVKSSVDFVILLVGMSLIWDIFFSPFGAERRLEWAFAFVLLSLRAPLARTRTADAGQSTPEEVHA
jgi:hypothetical protein